MSSAGQRDSLTIPVGRDSQLSGDTTYYSDGLDVSAEAYEALQEDIVTMFTTSRISSPSQIVQYNQ